MPEPITIVDAVSIAKDITLSGALVWALRGVMNRTWVPGSYYQDALARAEKAESHALMAHDAAERATRVSEQLTRILQER